MPVINPTPQTVPERHRRYHRAVRGLAGHVDV